MFKLFTISLTFLTMVANIDSDKNYGSFDVVLKRFDFCKGPKTKDCASGITKLDNETSVSVDIVVNENVIPLKGKVIASATGSPNEIRLLLNKPCDHLFVKPILQAFLHINSKCEILKGKYNFHMDFQDMVRKYYGGKNFYGAWKFKSLFYNNNCNIFCTQTEVHLVPAKK